jgi:uncharacterized cupredoxin-like copper-binding protein/mono/diheme cytochrome c family protein
VGAVQRLATVVVIGLVALATVLVLYLADENNRIKAEEQEQREAAIERGIQNYISLCLQCHGPAGEGFMEPGAAGTGRIGMPLGGNTYATKLNQEGIQANGTPYPGGVAARATVIAETIKKGRNLMPAWGVDYGGPLIDAQIDDLVLMIQHVDWNRVYNEAIKTYGGYPTPPPAATQPAASPTPAAPQPTPAPGGEAVTEVTIVAGKPGEMNFDPANVTIAAGTDVKITLKNEGALPHNFSIDALQISVDLMPGETKEITVNAPAGTYDFYCNVPGHREAGMVGTLVAQAAGAAPQQAAAQPTPAGGQQPAVGGGEAPAATAIEVVAGKPSELQFQPAQLSIPADTEVKVTLRNEGALPHNFAIDELQISVDILPGETKEFTIKAPAGTYQFYCNVPGHKEAGMVGTLTVAGGGAAATTSGGEQPAQPAQETTGGQAAAAQPVTIVAGKPAELNFDPATVTIPAGTDVKITLKNEGALPHNFSIAALNISEDLAPGETKEITVNAPAGEYDFHCNVPGHTEAGMVGKLIAQ